MRLPRVAAAACVAGLVAVAAACAREGAPPGGPVDRRPPLLVRTVPDTFAVVPRFHGPVRFVLDERISETTGGGGTLDDAVLVSPLTGAVHVSHDSHGVSVTLDGGFKRDLVYRVTLLPVLRDLFHNQMQNPIDLVFSTGAAFDRNALAGMVWNRVTGKPIAAAVVHAISDSDSLVYQSRADSGGIYAFRYLPAGHYDLVAFQDENRNDRPDFSELQGRRTILMGPKDTVLSEDVAILRPDTLPAHVVADTALDSVTVAVRFDDYLSPTAPVSQISVQVLRADSTPGPSVARLLYAKDYDRYVTQVRDSFARLDSLAMVEAAKRRPAHDTTPLPAPPPHHLPPALPRAPGEPGAPVGGAVRGLAADVGPDGTLLPSNRLVVLLASPLDSGETYHVHVSGVININGVPLGGGTTTVVYIPPKPPKADTTKGPGAASDTAKVHRAGADTSKARGAGTDTTRTGAAGVDTTRERPPAKDTTAADTTHLRLRARAASLRAFPPDAWPGREAGDPGP